MSQQVASTTGQKRLSDDDVCEFRTRIRGRVLCPGDEGYDDARKIWNGIIDRHPAAIVRCTGTADVVEAVRFARARDLLLSVRGGGHNVAGLAVCDDGLMADLSLLKGIRVDSQQRTVWAQPGATWGDLDRETQAFGLVTPGGFISTTGIAGLTLGGGFGWLSRRYGWTCDNLLSADVVTADGRCLHASPTEHADLFWGLRGGGGNFGIVTSFQYRLHPLDHAVTAGVVVYPMEQAAEVLRFYREFAGAAPEAMGSMVQLRIAPPAPFLPTAIHGQPVVMIVVCHSGLPDDATRDLRALRAFGNPVADTIGPKPYTVFQSMFDATVPTGRRYYWKSEYLPGLSDAALSTILAQTARFSSPLSAVVFFQLGGAGSRARDTAAFHRDATFVLSMLAAWNEPPEADRHIAWTRALWSAMRPYSIGGTYINFLSTDEGADRVREAYGPNYDRLVALKNAYDPTNLFRMNQNIRPTV